MLFRSDEDKYLFVNGMMPSQGKCCKIEDNLEVYTWNNAKFPQCLLVNSIGDVSESVMSWSQVPDAYNIEIGLIAQSWCKARSSTIYECTEFPWAWTWPRMTLHRWSMRTWMMGSSFMCDGSMWLSSGCRVIPKLEAQQGCLICPGIYLFPRRFQVPESVNNGCFGRCDPRNVCGREQVPTARLDNPVQHWS